MLEARVQWCGRGECQCVCLEQKSVESEYLWSSGEDKRTRSCLSKGSVSGAT